MKNKYFGRGNNRLLIDKDILTKIGKSMCNLLITLQKPERIRVQIVDEMISKQLKQQHFLAEGHQYFSGHGFFSNSTSHKNKTNETLTTEK